MLSVINAAVVAAVINVSTLAPALINVSHSTGPVFDQLQIYMYLTNVFSVRRQLCTRKPCYRKDDRAMRPIYRCPEKFRESSQSPPATFPEICKGFLFRSILRMCIQNLKFVALSVPEIIGGIQKIWAVPV